MYKASRVSLQVRERLHDRNGVLGWSRIKESAVSRTESKSDDKYASRLKAKKEVNVSTIPLSLSGNVGGGVRDVGHDVAQHISGVESTGFQGYQHPTNSKKVNNSLASCYRLTRI